MSFRAEFDTGAVVSAMESWVGQPAVSSIRLPTGCVLSLHRRIDCEGQSYSAYLQVTGVDVQVYASPTTPGHWEVRGFELGLPALELKSPSLELVLFEMIDFYEKVLDFRTRPRAGPELVTAWKCSCDALHSTEERARQCCLPEVR